jgi:hypothetical protein
MGKTTLVEVDLKIAERIVSALESHGVPVAAALWVNFQEYENWRLVIAAKKLDKLDPSDAYLTVNRITKDAGITVWESPTIHLMKTTDPFIRAIRKVYGKAPEVVGMRLGGRMWADRYIEDGFAYKVA